MLFNRLSLLEAPGYRSQKLKHNCSSYSTYMYMYSYCGQEHFDEHFHFHFRFRLLQMPQGRQPCRMEVWNTSLAPFHIECTESSSNLYLWGVPISLWGPQIPRALGPTGIPKTRGPHITATLAMNSWYFLVSLSTIVISKDCILQKVMLLY